MNLKPVLMAGREILPLVEGGKGIAVSTGLTCGRWASCGGMGTLSGVNPEIPGPDGKPERKAYGGTTREERQRELIEYGIRGCLAQAAIAHEESKGRGLVAMNIMWEQGGAQELLNAVLEKARGTIRAVSCGAGMPFRLADICAKYKTYYNPIVSSARAFQILWKRSFFRFREWLGAVIYEDPWLAGGHNGLSNAEDPAVPEKPFARVREIRRYMNEIGLKAVPIIIAGGVWWLSEWAAFIGGEEIGPVAFQFGTRPMVTIESPVSLEVKKKLLSVDEGDVSLQRFSPTGFYSSAVRNALLRGMEAALSRQVPFADSPGGSPGFDTPFAIANGASVYVKASDMEKIGGFAAAGFTKAVKTPDSTLVFLGPEKHAAMLSDMKNCMGCISACLFSGWSQRGNSGLKPDPRSFCIQRSLQDMVRLGDPENALLFAGHIAWRFKSDPFYRGGAFIPTIAELFERIMTGY